MGMVPLGALGKAIPGWNYLRQLPRDIRSTKEWRKKKSQAKQNLLGAEAQLEKSAALGTPPTENFWGKDKSVALLVCWRLSIQKNSKFKVKYGILLKCRAER